MIQAGPDSAPASLCLLPCLLEWEKAEDIKLEELFYFLFIYFFKLVKLKSIKERKEMSVIYKSQDSGHKSVSNSDPSP